MQSDIADYGYRYLVDKRGDIYDTYIDEFIPYGTSGSHGYYTCYLCDINGKFHSELVHRVVAHTWIGDVTGKQVHHKNHNKLDPRVKNLEILENSEHHILHNKGSNNSTAKLTEKDVEQICELLLQNIKHKEIAKIMSRKKRDFITVDIIDKIASGVNWTHITKKYNLKKEKREVMNEFSDKAIEIARMKVVEGLSNKDIANRLGVDTSTKSYTRLLGCIPRYVDNFNNGKYGLFRKQK